MKDYELLPQYLYFNGKLKKMPTVSEMIKCMYCRWHYDECARYRIALVMGPENVSPDLFPPDAERSETILARFNQLIGPKNKKYK